MVSSPRGGRWNGSCGASDATRYGVGAGCAALFQTLARAREAIPELRFREAVVEGSARRRHIGGQRACVRRLSALNQHEGKRDEGRQQRDPAPEMQAAIVANRAPGTRRRIRSKRPAHALIVLEFRTRPDHPPTAPIFNRVRIYFSALAFRRR
jgi:hypothetical protein